MSTTRKMVVLTHGHSNPHSAKTACSVIRYRPDEVVAVLDGTVAVRTSGELLGVGGDIPVVASLDDAPSANTLLIGIAPPGGKIPDDWRVTILAAIERGMHVLSGLHQFLGEDPEFSQAARRRGVELIDIRKNRERDISQLRPLRPGCLRVHTVGHDCSVGKMVAAIEITRGLQRRGRDAKFVATGQTGIMVEGDGCPVDCVVADFISGSVERLVLANHHHDFLLIEGQGSLVHPSYSSVTLGLLHGCVPQGLVLCYEVGREVVTGIPHMRIPPLATIKHLNETMANALHPCQVIGIAMNSRRVDEPAALDEKKRREDEFGLPVCDIFRWGCEELVDAVLKLQAEVIPAEVIRP